MNTSRLIEIVQVLLDATQKHRIAKLLNGFQNHLNNLVSNPANPPFQTETASSLAELEAATQQLFQELEPHQINAIEQIGGSSFFLQDFTAEFKIWLTENPSTPAAAKQKADAFIKQFHEYIDTLTKLKANLVAIGVQPLELIDGQPELGFLIPRTMFDNHLEKMIKELRNVNRILRVFSELETGEVTPAEVRTISTTDPLYTFGLPLGVILSLGKVVNWALGVWKQVEEIREVRARTLKIESFTEEEIEDFYGKKIKRHIEEAIDKKVKELMESRSVNKTRAHEVRQEVHFSLEYILAGIERGMVIEIRHLPPPSEPAQEADKVSVETQISEVARQLSFPAVDPSTAVLALPKEPEKPPSKTK